MKINFLRFLCLISTIVACATVHAQTANPSLTISDKKLTLQMNTKCPQPRPSRDELAKYLAQYDPKQEEGLSTYDEDRPFTKKGIKEMRDYLVRDGFHYPNSQESVITWMDFDGDGICDFTASAGIGGMKSIDRMFLFRGLSNGKFQLMDSYLEYMDSSIVLVPYIPIQVSGEKLPMILGGGLLMQWRNERKKFEVCERSSVIAERRKLLGNKIEKPKNSLEALCPHQQNISKWAKDQLPNKNEVSHAYIDFDK